MNGSALGSSWFHTARRSHTDHSHYVFAAELLSAINRQRQRDAMHLNINRYGLERFPSNLLVHSFIGYGSYVFKQEEEVSENKQDQDTQKGFHGEVLFVHLTVKIRRFPSRSVGAMWVGGEGGGGCTLTTVTFACLVFLLQYRR